MTSNQNFCSNFVCRENKREREWYERNGGFAIIRNELCGLYIGSYTALWVLGTLNVSLELKVALKVRNFSPQRSEFWTVYATTACCRANAQFGQQAVDSTACSSNKFEFEVGLSSESLPNSMLSSYYTFWTACCRPFLKISSTILHQIFIKFSQYHIFNNLKNLNV